MELFIVRHTWDRRDLSSAVDKRAVDMCVVANAGQRCGRLVEPSGRLESLFVSVSRRIDNDGEDLVKSLFYISIKKYQ